MARCTFYLNLHSNMVRLKDELIEPSLKAKYTFTFQYGKIKSDNVESGIWCENGIYIPIW